MIVHPRIGVRRKPQFPDPHAILLARQIREYLHLPLEEVEILRAYTIEKSLKKEQLQAIAQHPMIDQVTEIGLTEIQWDKRYHWCVEVCYKPGLTDNTGNTAKTTIQDFLQELFSEYESVHSSRFYFLKGPLTKVDVERVAFELLANPLIEEIRIHEQEIKVSSEIFLNPENHPQIAEEVPVDLSDHDLLQLSKNRKLALNLQEMQAIRQYYAKEEIKREREQAGIGKHPTDVEIEALAQTWSEHCKHKIFNAKIHYTHNGKTETINSLFKSYIKQATDEIAQNVDWLVSVFTDNAGIIRFDKEHNLAFKVETHNSPSALDPYGGALTGILGVNRDILGAGRGARLIANTDIFCFAPLDYDKPVPKRLLHPKRVFEGVRQGVEHGGNKSGIPTVNGAIVFDERFLGKPLVYCGSVGIIPREIQSQKTEIKEILPGDRILVAGGRTGKDGIHGATFSSEQLHADSPTSAVQIGDPFTQKKLADFLMEARGRGLYRTLTDNGAGGFSSSIGELAELSNGCEIHLDRALLKYRGMLPWEILLSESQERMTLAVPKENIDALQKLADLHEVEIADLGAFTSSGKMHVLYYDKNVAYLDLSFLHHGVPQMELFAEWSEPEQLPFVISPSRNLGKDLHAVLFRYNVCSKENVIRQYDHEVQAQSALKPLVGVENDGPSDAAILRLPGSDEAIALSNGICPKYSDIDAYHMAACAIDEAVRNQIAVGADPSRIAILDNFCWPDPVEDPLKCAHLVRANKALYDMAKAFGTPIISGKDSMKNDYQIDGIKISVPPTLLISAIGKIPHVERSVSMDVKFAGDSVYLIGWTRNELGGSEYASHLNLEGGIVPKVDAETAVKCYRALFDAIQEELIASCHDCSDGGLAAALAEMAFAGGLGLEIDLEKVLHEKGMTPAEILFSESASRLLVTIDPENEKQFEQFFRGCPLARIGQVTEIPELRVHNVLTENIYELKKSWKREWDKSAL